MTDSSRYEYDWRRRLSHVNDWLRLDKIWMAAAAWWRRLRGLSVTLYSLNRSLPNLVRLIKSVTPIQMPILIKFGWVGNSPQIGEIISVTFCSVHFFVGSPSGKTPERICTHRPNGSKRVKSAKDVPFGGFVKNGNPTPTNPKIPKILHYQSRFSLKTRIKRHQNS